jgi:hypothetical protein
MRDGGSASVNSFDFLVDDFTSRIFEATKMEVEQAFNDACDGGADSISMRKLRSIILANRENHPPDMSEKTRPLSYWYASLHLAGWIT